MRFFTRSIPEWIDPHSCILPLPDQVAVSRPSAYTIRLQWPAAAEKVQIFSSTNPDQIDFSKPAATAVAQTAIELPVSNMNGRPYFALLFEGGEWHGRCLITAERLLPLQGAVNFRDIGGYETRDGGVTAWNRLYRSGVLSELTERDMNDLQRLGIKLVCDMRSEQEVEKRPDKLPANPTPHYLHVPAQSLERSARLRGLAAILFNQAKLEGLMDEGYTNIMIDNNADLIGKVLKNLAMPTHLPAIVHCSAGKDRTAVIVALLLSVLNVPQETILADYTLSNIHYEKYKAGIDEDLAPLKRFGIHVDQLQAVILVKGERLQTMFAHIQQKYGTVENYLQQAASLNENIFAKLKQNFLTTSCSTLD